MEGWIKLHRQIVENPYYFSEPFNRTLAWIDLLILANHKDNFFYKRGIKVEVKRGQVGYDLEKLSSRWRWSRGKAERFISDLETSEQVIRQKTNVTTLITIVKYNECQHDDKANGKASSKPNDKADGHQIVKQTETNKNEENENNEEKIDSVIFYLNSKTGKNFKSDSEANKKFIAARLKSYSIEHIKMVVDLKTKEWLGTNMEKYLRPETLFNATKFEGYVNELSKKEQMTDDERKAESARKNKYYQDYINGNA